LSSRESSSSRAEPFGLRRRASIDLGALTRNISRLAADRPNAAVDGRANASGLGIEHLAEAAAAAGVRRIRVSPGSPTPTGFELNGDDLGLGIYGFESGDTVLTLSSEVVSTKRVPAGTGVSYGYTFRTVDDTNLALVSLGFADGIPRASSNRASVSIGGRRFPTVGRIAMDQFVVNIGSDTVELGDSVILFGSPELGHPEITEWADAARLTPEQLTSRLGARITREAAGPHG
jgi:alanine racemase